ncbi:Nucleotide binding protein PINc [Methanococcus vannielii SB]|uniref:Nucleotide binding protein PINc n=1 Tax=Methanococcus vannielii (strain ATCC 35089 / DSM 1224 / JCM 13029 / OCM 148 / SB) TaxID=406327 RepID=A6URY7_METVS|nr:type II toxin-antitoxin system VapC family toxin [Methanococcus vannielii]ABR55259.1 Nucleotide binding protein PINc [Methanococcus vannielii SB]
MIKILDASAFIHGYNPSIEEGIHYTTNGIVLEVVSKEEIIKSALDYGKLKILDPKIENIENVSKMTLNTGDTLSKNDIEILALAIELEGILYTDDYGIQNVSKKLNVKYKNIIAEGSKNDFIWKKLCKGCKAMYPINYPDSECDVCGSELHRKMVKNRLKKSKNSKTCKKT